jgi:2,4-diketo-3-deoxy-L-fuconate hydrolase
MKATSAIVGCNDDLMLPKGSEKTDWEVELGVVIGRTARYVDPDRALEHVAGYVLINDVSERDFQKERGGQWVKGKSADTFAPVGPFVCTADELSPVDLHLWLELNGRLMQDDRTSSMLFDVATLVSYTSEFMTLCPGDLISTGTPSGVGAGQQPPRYLRPGDVVACGIDGLGESRRRVVAFSR